ncbi:MAG: GtrA family protein [Caulobacteraceae bacterium]|nr:GtrA family protein [Caulobacteraceae bacterium]
MPRFIRNALVSLPTFLVDLALLYLLVRRAHIGYLTATLVSFFAANTLGYFLSRRFVFEETTRGVGRGLVYFLIIALLAAAALTPLMWLLVSVLHIEFIWSRIAAATIVGIGGYLLNLIFNFRIGPRRPGQVV